jgi:hypothetical protein
MNLAKLAGDLDETRNDAILCTGKPKILSAWPRMIESATPLRKPTRIGATGSRRGAEAQEASGDAQNAGEQGERYGQRGVCRLVAGGKRRTLAATSARWLHRGQRSIAATAEDRIGDERQYARIKSYFRAKAGSSA